MTNSLPSGWVEENDREYVREDVDIQLRVIPAPHPDNPEDGFDVRLYTNRGDDGADTMRLHLVQETEQDAHELAEKYMKRFNSNELDTVSEVNERPRQILLAALRTVIELRD